MDSQCRRVRAAWVSQRKSLRSGSTMVRTCSANFPAIAWSRLVRSAGCGAATDISPPSGLTQRPTRGDTPHMDRSPLLPVCVQQGRVSAVTLRNPARRNALDLAALNALEHAIREARQQCEERVSDCVVVRADGEAFCAGFDLAACAETPALVGDFLHRLSACVQTLRSIDAPVVARVQGAALAGGCALLTGCDFVAVATNAQLGYPTHRIGISPAVSIPSLFSRMGGNARALLLANDLIDGNEALARGLATSVSQPEALDRDFELLVARVLSKGPEALRATKAWLRTLEERGDGVLGRVVARDQHAFERARDASIALGEGDEFASMLRAFWASRGGR